MSRECVSFLWFANIVSFIFGGIMDKNLDLEYADRFLSEFYSLGPFKDVKRANRNNEGLGLIVGYLYDQNGKVVYAGDLAKVSGVSTARIAAALKKLEGLGLVQRVMSEKDCRKTVVRLTPLGRKRAEEKRKEFVEYTAKVIEKVGKEDMETLLRILCSVKHAMSELNKGDRCV